MRIWLLLGFWILQPGWAAEDKDCPRKFGNLRLQAVQNAQRVVYHVPESFGRARGDFVANIRLFKGKKIEFFRFGGTDYPVTAMENGMLTVRHPRDSSFFILGNYEDVAGKPAARVSGQEMGREIKVTLYLGPEERAFINAHWKDK